MMKVKRLSFILKYICPLNNTNSCPENQRKVVSLIQQFAEITIRQPWKRALPRLLIGPSEFSILFLMAQHDSNRTLKLKKPNLVTS